jgi:hypothetical protein
MKFAKILHRLSLLALWPAALSAQITITGVADKTTYNNTATLTIGTQAGFDYNATLNWKPIATGVPVVVNKPDFYELRVDATNQVGGAVTSVYRRFIVLDTTRVGTEWGLPTHVPFPVIQSSPSEFVGTRLRVLTAANIPAGWPGWWMMRSTRCGPTACLPQAGKIPFNSNAVLVLDFSLPTNRPGF